MPRLGIDKDFLREFTKLEKSVQARVTEAFAKFEAASYAGLHLEKLTNPRDDRFRTIKITNFWRGVVLAPGSGGSYTLLKVLPHDDAYAWAQRRSASVNAATGRIEIRDVVAVDASLPAFSRMADSATARLFDHVKDSELRQLGIDEQTREFAWALTDSVQLDAAKSFLPRREVVLAQQVSSADEYLTANRTGRGRRLGTRQKAQVWQAIWEFERTLHERDVFTHETVCVEAAALLDQMEDKPYQSIIVDESQDLSPVQWRLLRRSVPEQSNDLLLAGDTHQRIYNSRVSLRDVGIRVAGRSTRLNVNYRTTAEILAWSLGLLRGERIDNMDEGLESIAGCRSDVHGDIPRIRGFRTRDAELDQLVSTVREWLAAGVQPDEIGIAVRSNKLVESVSSVLMRESIPRRKLTGAQNAGDSAVSVGTMYRMKGLEFRCLAVAAVTEHHVPPSTAVTPIEDDEPTHHHDLQRERCLLL